MVNMNTNTQSGAGNVGLSGTTAGGSCGIEAGPSRSEISQSIVECHNNNHSNTNNNNNNNINNNNNANRNCNSGDTGSWKLLQQDPGKMSKLRDLVENSTSVASKCIVESLLQQVNDLSDIEKLLLYLKLPVGRSPDLDPLKQPLNPLGSRSEIQLTITWMKTHLETDLEVSLPKEEVYNEYMEHFTNNGLKPLSTADFGKVMKQVFPSVRARRLGHRGASKYCHSGLRKKYMLDVPSLPDVSENSSNGSAAHKNLFGLGSPCDDVQRAALRLVMEWAEKLCNIKFETFRDLAVFLLDKNYVDNRSMAAFTVLDMDQRPGSNVGKHRETQVQLQKKLQEREQFRDQKRKLQEQHSGASKSLPDRPKTRRRSGTVVRNTATASDSSALNHRSSGTATSFGNSKSSLGSSTSAQDGKTGLGSHAHNGRYESLESNVESKKDPIGRLEDRNNTLLSSTEIKREDEPSTAQLAFPSLFHDGKNEKGDRPKYLPVGSTDAVTVADGAATIVKGCSGSSLPDTPKTYYTLSTPASNGPGNTAVGEGKNQYKSIHPKGGGVPETNNNNNNNNNNIISLSSTEILTNKNNLNENIMSGCSSAWPKTASSHTINPLRMTKLDTALESTNAGTLVDPYQVGLSSNHRSSTDQDDFPLAPCSIEMDDRQKSSQLSELRKLLQNKLPNGSASGPACLGMPSAPLSLDDPSAELDPDGSGAPAGIRRRVSFQPAVEGSVHLNALFGAPTAGQILPPGTTNPSCNKSCNFTPIPHPPSGGMMSQGVSQASSANASPFMSPCNTPLPRSRHNSGQTSSTYVTPRSTPFTPDLGQPCSIPSENSTPFMSPAPTPILPRSRHNSSQTLRTIYPPTSRSRHSSGAPNYRHTPYADDLGARRGNKYRSRHSSGSIPPSPQSAPLSPLVHDSGSHPLSDPLLFHHHHHQQQQQQQQQQHQQQQLLGCPSSTQSLHLTHPSQQVSMGACNDLRRRHLSAGPTIHYQPQVPPLSFSMVPTCSGVDPLSQEVSNVMTNPTPGVGLLSSGSTNRPQSVPLLQMLQTSSAVEMDFMAKSHPSTPLVGGPFHFGSDCSSLSHPPSYAPTPVPSEYNDFGDYSNLEFDPVLGGDASGNNSGLESIDSSFCHLTAHTNFDHTLSESLTGAVSGADGGLVEPTFGTCEGVAHFRSSQGEEGVCSRSQGSTDCSTIHCTAPATISGKGCGVPCSASDSVASGKTEQSSGTQPLIFSGSSQITLNALNSLHTPDMPLRPPSSDLEDVFQPSLEDLSEHDLNSIYLDSVNKD